jgi:hypothetical protein
VGDVRAHLGSGSAIGRKPRSADGAEKTPQAILRLIPLSPPLLIAVKELSR